MGSQKSWCLLLSILKSYTNLGSYSSWNQMMTTKTQRQRMRPTNTTELERTAVGTSTCNKDNTCGSHFEFSYPWFKETRTKAIRLSILKSYEYSLVIHKSTKVTCLHPLLKLFVKNQFCSTPTKFNKKQKQSNQLWHSSG